MFKPVIVVIAYNRPSSLDRILTSISNASYPNDSVRLIISIDRNDKDINNNKVFEMANKYNWEHGEKEIIFQEENLGLRKHIIKCGDLLNQFDSLIMLEDDLFVSPYFYRYSIEALEFYKNHSYVGGIALYNYSFNETARLPFTPIDDGNDSYFLQLACSWGQVWTSGQWKLFKKSYDQKPSISENNGIPKNIIAWPESSWKKYFTKYLVDNNKYFVYPRYSLTTNFSDEGGFHIKQSTTLFQVPILNNKRNFKFVDINDSLAVYDVYCEILPEKLNSLTSLLKEYHFECDLYGTKEIDSIQSPYLLTTQNYGMQIEKSFGLKMKPHELNVIYNIEGDRIFLIKRENIIKKYNNLNRLLYLHEYFYTKITRKTILLMIKKLYNQLLK